MGLGHSSSLIEGSHMTKNTAAGIARDKYLLGPVVTKKVEGYE